MAGWMNVVGGLLVYVLGHGLTLGTISGVHLRLGSLEARGVIAVASPADGNATALVQVLLGDFETVSARLFSAIAALLVFQGLVALSATWPRGVKGAPQDAGEPAPVTRADQSVTK